MEHTECSETLAHKIQMPGNHPDERIQHSEQGKSLKSSIVVFFTQVLNARAQLLP
jgi:predicted SnoaL-like aldol condensation-catalyzing enzyme